MKISYSSYKLLISLIVCLLTLVGSYFLYLKLTDDFRISNIIFDIPFKENWAVEQIPSSEKQKLLNLFNQEFHYLGKGAQTYVFLSEDKKYVIKFFKFKHLKSSFWINFLPAKYRDANIARKQKKIDRVFQGYLTAYRDYQTESGLVFIHLNLNQNEFEGKTVHLRDKLGISKIIHLDSVVFVVQEAGVTLRNTLKPLLKAECYEVAKDKIGQILDLYLVEYKKGLQDFDYRVLDNAGFIGDRPVHLDVGMLRRDVRMKFQEFYLNDFERIAYTIKQWVDRRYPKASQEIQIYMQNKISKQFDFPFYFDKNDDEIFKRHR